MQLQPIKQYRTNTFTNRVNDVIKYSIDLLSKLKKIKQFLIPTQTLVFSIQSKV